MNDGTSIINPNGNAMYLVLVCKRRQSGPSIRQKVTSLHEALTIAEKWRSDNYLYARQIKKALVYVKGAPLAWIDSCEGKVYRADPITERAIHESLLLDGKKYREYIANTDAREIEIRSLHARYSFAEQKCWALLLEPLIAATAHLSMIDLNEARAQLALANGQEPHVVEALVTILVRTMGDRWESKTSSVKLRYDRYSSNESRRFELSVYSQTVEERDNVIDAWFEMIDQIHAVVAIARGVLESETFVTAFDELTAARGALKTLESGYR